MQSSVFPCPFSQGYFYSHFLFVTGKVLKRLHCYLEPCWRWSFLFKSWMKWMTQFTPFFLLSLYSITFSFLPWMSLHSSQIGCFVLSLSVLKQWCGMVYGDMVVVLTPPRKRNPLSWEEPPPIQELPFFTPLITMWLINVNIWAKLI